MMLNSKDAQKQGVKFWIQTVFLVVCAMLCALGVGYVVISLLDLILPFLTIVSALLGMMLTVTIIVSGFYFFFYKKPHSEEFISTAKKYIHAVNLVQNLAFFMLFPFLGIVINITGDSNVSVFRYAIGASLLILKSSMLVIQYATQYYPMDERVKDSKK